MRKKTKSKRMAHRDWLRHHASKGSTYNQSLKKAKKSYKKMGW